MASRGFMVGSLLSVLCMLLVAIGVNWLLA